MKINKERLQDLTKMSLRKLSLIGSDAMLISVLRNGEHFFTESTDATVSAVAKNVGRKVTTRRVLVVDSKSLETKQITKVKINEHQ